jgi:hypothetical protein
LKKETQKTNLKEGDWIHLDVKATGGNRKKSADGLFIGRCRKTKKVIKGSFLITLPLTQGKTVSFYIRHLKKVETKE